MTHIAYHRKMNMVEISGHAGWGEEGKDIVCAAVSTLACTLAANMTDELVRDAIIRLEPGDAVIHAAARPKYKNVVTLIFDAIATGFEGVAEQYPENVKFAMYE